MNDAVEFHSLTVSVRPETTDGVCLSFDVPDELRETFRHRPGQHLVLRAEIDGEDVRRSYSICSSSADDSLSVGIKAIAGGVFSNYATTELASGDTIEVMAPIGDFGHQPDAAANARYVALAAGSGITPILSILASVLDLEPASSCTLVYGNRRTTSIMFLEEIEDLKNQYPDRLQVIHVLSRESNEIALFEGRIDAEKLRLLADSLISPDDVEAWFVCGPLDMVETARSTLEELGVSEDRVHFELFYDQRVDVPPEVDDAEGLVELTVTLDGRTSTVRVDPAGPPLLDYARSVRPEVPFACKGGMCATCKAQVLSGQVSMVKNFALTAAETADGLILSCQAHPEGDVAITYDVHGGVGR